MSHNYRIDMTAVQHSEAKIAEGFNIIIAIQQQAQEVITDQSRLLRLGQMEHLRNMVLAAHVELDEVLAEFPWKPWLKYNSSFHNVNSSALALELADVLIFLINIAEVGDVTGDMLAAAFVQKIGRNVNRALQQREPTTENSQCHIVHAPVQVN